MQSECEYPCATCSLSDRSQCLSCWNDPLAVDPDCLMDYGNGTSICKSSCDHGYSCNTDLNLPSKVCQDCHESCSDAPTGGCRETSIYNCIECNKPAFKFRLIGTDHCLAACENGYFADSEHTCSRCVSPCIDCLGTATNCTSCQSPLLLFGNQCV